MTDPIEGDRNASPPHTGAPPSRSSSRPKFSFVVLSANLLKGAALLWLIVHMAMTAILVSPSNPIRLVADRFILPIMNVFFSQNWCFFAPDPLDTDEALLARCLTPLEATAARAGAIPANGWYDLSTPFWVGFQRNRFTAYDRLIRPQSAAIRSSLGYPMEVGAWVKACRDGSKEACQTLEKQMKPIHERDNLLLAQVASGFCTGIAAGPGTFTDAALRVRVTQPVPWSQRKTGKPITKDFDLGVVRVEPSAAQTHLFRVRGAV